MDALENLEDLTTHSQTTITERILASEDFAIDTDSTNSPSEHSPSMSRAESVVSGRPRSASKSMSQMELEKLRTPAVDLATAVEQLSSEPSPLSLGEARAARRDRCLKDRKDRSDSIEFLRQRTASRRSSASQASDSEQNRQLSAASPLNPTAMAGSSSKHITAERKARQVEEAAKKVAIPYALMKPRGKPVTAPTKLNEASVIASESNTGSGQGSQAPQVTYQGERQSQVEGISKLSLSDPVESKDSNNEALATNVPDETGNFPNKPQPDRSNSQPIITQSTMSEALPLPTTVEVESPQYGEDQSDEETDVSVILAEQTRARNHGPRTEPHAYTPWAANIKWFYMSGNLQEDANAMVGGSVPFNDPKLYISTDNKVRNQPGREGAPAVLSSTQSNGPYPTVTFDEVNFRFVISPSSQPFQDFRNEPEHPDFLPVSKICEYQAYEFAGFQVWRHDRNNLVCFLSSCHAATLDHEIPTVICHGCGPKAYTRYCCRQHLFDDIKDHWKECGSTTTIIPHPIDGGSQPARFNRRYPAITDINGMRSFQKHRQRTHAIYNKGQYTMFSAQGMPFIIEWPEHLKATHMGRVERLLNVALLDQSETTVLQYLYMVLRSGLRATNQWTRIHELVLRLQFKLEFAWEAAVAPEEDPCECDWSGDASGAACSSACRSLQLNVGVTSRGGGLVTLVEQLEARHWQLRVWRRQHPTVRAWRRRLVGEGFVGVDKGACAELGVETLWPYWGKV